MKVWNTTKVDFGFIAETDEEAQIFTEIWTKVYNESKKAGYKNMFDKDQKQFIQMLQETWFGDEKKPEGIQNGPSHHVYVGDEG